MEISKIKTLKQNLWLVVFLLCMAAEYLSFLGFNVPIVGTATLMIIALAAFVLALTGVRQLFAVVMVEMIVGTNGRMFSMDLMGFSVSLRMILFAALITGCAIHLARGNWREKHFTQAWIAPPLLLLVSALALGVMRGLSDGVTLRVVFDDANAYAFLLLIPIGLKLISNRENFVWLSRIMIGAATWLAVKCLILLYLFTHDFGPILKAIFDWQRVLRLAEITQLSGGAVRVFSSSEVFLIPAVFLGAFFAWQYGRRKMLAWAGLITAAFLLSLSRSFWLGASVASVLMLPVLIRKSIVPVNEFGKFAVAGFKILIIAISSILLIMLIPIPGRSTGSGSWDAYRQRLSGSPDAAVSSRWNMLAPLETGIREHPVLGSGFGSTITYRSDDLRVIELNPGGVITTGAIEWQYLEIWLKLGLLGLLAIVWLWWRIGLLFWKTIQTARGADRLLAAGLMLSLLAFVVANIFTPYINHPLGWGFLTLIIVGLNVTREEESSVSSS